MFVTHEDIQAARVADLYGFLYSHHSDKFTAEGNSLRFVVNPSLSIKKGFTGFFDFATNESGNSVDFLIKNLGYSFVEAVVALAPFKTALPVPTVSPPKADIHLPTSTADFTAARNYLLGRGFTADILKFLRESHLLYQDTRRNVVFISKNRDFYEIRGTCPGKSFHQCQRQLPGAYWSFSLIDGPERAFICESSIDAVSLMLLHLSDPAKVKTAKSSLYCSIAGVANQAAILHISRQYPCSILAVDNDPAGDACRERNPYLVTIRPVRKDWNEDLMHTKGI